MKPSSVPWFRYLILTILFVRGAATGFAAPVLMISIDGLKPEYLLQADELGLRIPTLRRFVREGTYAEGVIASLPTVTYPNHTTLITGVWPAEHGILNNPLFDPERKLGGAWYWYADSVKVPTLWDAAHEAGIGTASVSWPVSVNATSVGTLIPEYWRNNSPGEGNNPQDRYIMAAISRPDGALEEMEQRIGPYIMGNDTSVEHGDEVRTQFALDILARKEPGFMTIHLSAMDASEHASGVFSPEANKTLEAVDGMVSRLMAAALKNDPQARIVIVSDHGFLNITHTVNFLVPFTEHGLIQTGKHVSDEGESTIVAAWKAQLWSAGGVVAVMLHDPSDAATREQVHTLLATLAANPNNGIDKVIDPAQIAERGGFPDAAYLIVMKPGYAAGAATSGPLVVPQTTVHGGHGYWPLYPEMHSSFFVLGDGVAHGRDLGIIDMRQIAPTVAKILGAKMPSAKQPPLHIDQ
jgi:predicted AlkP superfamily pyrophosphatase or phosphodiesterase